MKQYYGIKAWGLYTGSNIRYIHEQIRLAKVHNAPENAIYCTGDKSPNSELLNWFTTDSIGSEYVRLHILTSMDALKQDAEKPGWNE